MRHVHFHYFGKTIQGFRRSVVPKGPYNTQSIDNIAYSCFENRHHKSRTHEVEDLAHCKCIIESIIVVEEPFAFLEKKLRIYLGASLLVRSQSDISLFIVDFTDCRSESTRPSYMGSCELKWAVTLTAFLRGILAFQKAV